jgi:hypothetical protein
MKQVMPPSQFSQPNPKPEPPLECVVGYPPEPRSVPIRIQLCLAAMAGAIVAAAVLAVVEFTK